MTILVPIDPTDPSRAAVSVAALLAQDLGEQLLLLHVSAELPPLARLAELHAIAEPVRAEGLVVRLRTVQGDVVERILERSRAADVSWVVMGTRGPSLLAGHHGDSVAWRTLQRANAPVVAVRPGLSGAKLGGGALLVVAPPEHARPADLAASLARVSGGRSLSAEVDPAAPGLLRLRSTRSPIAPAAVILSFAEDCVQNGHCQRVIEQIPALVMVVGGGEVPVALAHAV